MSEGIEHSLGPGENDLRASRSRSRSVQQNQHGKPDCARCGVRSPGAMGKSQT